jgi:hypothetical protein
VIQTTASFEERVRLAFVPTPRAVLGLVDDLLELAREQPLSLTFRSGMCVVSPAGEASNTVEVPLPKSVFRAVLARVAVLCNEQRPDSVSPYGGTGEVCVGPDPRTTLRVAFTNTPEEQRLELNG